LINIKISLCYLGGKWVGLYSQQAGPNAEGQWLSCEQNFTTVTGAAYIALKLKAADWTTLYVDTVDISIIPEPTTLLLIGLGGLALRWI
jgi:hypothetical protein